MPNSPPKTTQYLVSEPGGIELKAEVEHVEGMENDAKIATEFAQGASAAERTEHDLTFWQSLVNYKGAVFWSLGISMCIVMEGYDLALIGNLIALGGFRERYGTFVNEEQGYQISASWQSALTQAPTIGAFLGVLVSAQLAAKYGYRWTLQGFMILMTASIFLVFFSHSLPVLFAGQFLSGIPWGAFSVIPTAYASEVAPIKLRSTLTTYIQLCWCMGQFVSSGVLYSVKDMTGQWSYRIPFALQWVWPVPLHIAILFMPESPWWLVRQGKVDLAYQAVSRLGRIPRRDTSQILAMMTRTTEMEKATMEGASYMECFKGVQLRRTMIVCCTHAFANLTGLLMSNLGTYFFVVAGLPDDQAFALGLANTGIQFVAVLVAVPLAQRYGRRTLVMSGLGFNCVVMLIMGSLACLKQTKAVQWTQGILVIIVGLQWGLTLGPMCWTIVGETASLRLRAKTIGLSRDAYYLSSVTVGILNAYMLNPTGFGLIGKTGFVYLGTCFGCLACAYYYLPELKGRSYREADIMFNRRVAARRFAGTEIGEHEVE